ncbi:hypothetical protein SAMN05216532_0697 [Streptomyces sp. 2231.1]|uniref:hypothetical protein n=1 Tax=Streptomyces sp. 2231.1 TaxID=1855347 RepID=UPI00089752DD|nr:hypothetical protein [Streptomyces sp. 2231.1]SEC17851.1 hypothetical protein SAMN05216532_0697 [Streptomyces sp. 2231.1]
MSDQQASTALMAAAVVAVVLVARAAVLHQGGLSPTARAVRRLRRRLTSGTVHGAPSAAGVPDDAFSPVLEAEQHVYGYWQQVRTRPEPPE